MDTVINEVMEKIEEGMTVYDSTGKKVGRVRQVHMGDADPTALEPETVTDKEPPVNDNNLIEDIAEVFVPERDIPEEITKRLRRYGYIRIDAGMLHSDRIAANDQIAGVSKNSLTLNVNEAMLLKI